MKFSLLTIIYLQAHTAAILEQQSKLLDDQQTKTSGNLRFELVQAKSNQIEQYTTLQNRALSNNSFCRVGYNCYQGQCINNHCICWVHYYGEYCEYFQIQANNTQSTDSNNQESSNAGLYLGVMIAGGFVSLIVFICVNCHEKLKLNIVAPAPVSNDEPAPVLNNFPEIFNNPALARLDALKRYQSRNNLPPLNSESLPPRQGNAADINLQKRQKLTNIRTCSICLDNILIQLEYEINCPSKHVFHEKCINLWLLQNKTCPQCRAEIIR